MKIIIALLALTVSLSAQQPTVQAIVESGGASLTSGASPSSFSTLDGVDVYTPANKTSMTKAYFGFRVVFPTNVVIQIDHIHYYLRQDGSAYRDNTVNLFISPSGLSSPYCVVYDSSGNQTSVNNSAVAGSTVTGRTLIVGGHSWSFGSSPKQPLLNKSYAEGIAITGNYRNIGSTTLIPFSIQPGDPSWSNSNTVYSYAVIGVSPFATKEEWVSQLMSSPPTSGGEGVLNFSYTDPSGFLGSPGGYSVGGWQTSTDMVNWQPFSGVIGVSGNKSNILVNIVDSRRFFRIASDDVQDISWWLPDNN